MRGRHRIAALALVGSTIATPSVASADPTDGRIERQAVLRKSDLPAGWSSKPHQRSDPPAIPVCTNVRTAARALDPISAKSPDFVRDQFTMAWNAVAVLRSDRKAHSMLVPYQESSAARCWEELIKRAFDDPSITSLRVTVTPGNDAPPGVDEAVTFAIEINATSAGGGTTPAEHAVFHFDLLVGRVGRAVAYFTFSDEGRSLPDQGELVDAVVGRLQSAGV